MTIIEISYDTFENWYEAATLMEKCLYSELMGVKASDPVTGVSIKGLIEDFIPFVGAIASLRGTVDKWAENNKKEDWKHNPSKLMNLDVLMENPDKLLKCHFSNSVMAWLEHSSRSLGYLEELMALTDLGIKMDTEQLKTRRNKDVLITVKDEHPLIEKICDKITGVFESGEKDSLKDVCTMKYEAWLSDMNPEIEFGKDIPTELYFGKALSKNYKMSFKKKKYGIGFHKTLTKQFFHYLHEEQKFLMGWKTLRPFEIRNLKDHHSNRCYDIFKQSTKEYFDMTKNPEKDFNTLIKGRILELEALARFLKRIDNDTTDFNQSPFNIAYEITPSVSISLVYQQCTSLKAKGN